MKPLKKIPEFKNESQEFDFWSKHDSTEYLDVTKMKPVAFPNLRRTTKLVSINMPISLLDNLKFLASKKDIAYQTLMKLFLAKMVDKEIHVMKIKF